MRGFLRVRLDQGTRTSPFPDGGAELPERFRGRPTLDSGRCGDCRECAARMPSGALVVEPGRPPKLDLGACLFSPEETQACPNDAVRFTGDIRMAAGDREGLISETGEVGLARALDDRMRRLFGRSLRLRSVSAGSCNGCEAELVALGNVVFDLARFGVQFVASPRHADGMVLTGAVSKNMVDAVYRTYDAIPAPRLVIAVGACAINGGPFRGSPEVENGLPPGISCDLWIPGCPPHPLTVMDGLLRLLGRLDEGKVSRTAGGRGPSGPEPSGTAG